VVSVTCYFIGLKTQQKLLVQSSCCMVDWHDINKTVGCVGVGILKEDKYHTIGCKETMFLHLHSEIFSCVIFETVDNVADICTV
jgi:ammonia channel protein AmtB